MDRVGKLSQCDNQAGWVEHTINGATTCYWHNQLASLPWYEAENDCQSRGGNLAVISSQTENDLIYAEMGADDNNWWIGLSNYGKLDHGLAWTTKEQKYHNGFQNWAKGQKPKTDRPVETLCVQQLAIESDDCDKDDPDCVPDKEEVGKWRTTKRCGEEQQYICEAKPMGSCPEGWMLYSGFCYMINTSRMTTWIVAKDSCEAVGAQLLKIGSDEEQHFLKSTIYQTGEEVGTDKSIWIGFSDMEVDGTFRWTDGSQVQSSGYTNFADLQPENSPGQPDCGSFYMGNPNLYWETYNCFKEQGFICKIQAGQELKDTSHTEYKGCKPGWVAFKARIFLFHDHSPLSLFIGSRLKT